MDSYRWFLTSLFCSTTLLMVMGKISGEAASSTIELRPDETAYTYYFKSIKNSLFLIAPIKSSIYTFGSTSVQVCVPNCSFDLELRSIHNKNATSSFWFTTLKVVQTWMQFIFLKKDTSSCKTLVGLSRYQATYFIVKESLMCSNDDKVKIFLQHKVINGMCLLYLVLGLTIFIASSRLSKSVLFYYSSGTVIGVLASALVLIFIISRFVPKKPVAYSLVVGGWSLCGYIFSRIFEDLTEFVFTYYKFVFGYVFFTGFLTFAYCYYHGPISNPRTHDVIRWGLKFIGLVLIFNASHLSTVSITIILILVFHQLLSSVRMGENGQKLFEGISNISVLKTLLKLRPKPRKLLTEDEYVRQGRVETEKALEELKSFCHSPQCSPWKTLASLESPHRFAKFIEGDNHISMQEMTLYEEDMTGVFEDEKVDSSLMSEEDESIELIDLDVIDPSDKLNFYENK